MMTSHLESIGLDTLGLESVVIGIEGDQLGWQHGKLHDLIFSQ